MLAFFLDRSLAIAVWGLALCVVSKGSIHSPRILACMPEQNVDILFGVATGQWPWTQLDIVGKAAFAQTLESTTNLYVQVDLIR